MFAIVDGGFKACIKILKFIEQGQICCHEVVDLLTLFLLGLVKSFSCIKLSMLRVFNVITKEVLELIPVVAFIFRNL